jgi:hypothetical protein
MSRLGWVGLDDLDQPRVGASIQLQVKRVVAPRRWSTSCWCSCLITTPASCSMCEVGEGACLIVRPTSA